MLELPLNSQSNLKKREKKRSKRLRFSRSKKSAKYYLLLTDKNSLDDEQHFPEFRQRPQFIIDKAFEFIKIFAQLVHLCITLLQGSSAFFNSLTYPPYDIPLVAESDKTWFLAGDCGKFVFLCMTFNLKKAALMMH